MLTVLIIIKVDISIEKIIINLNAETNANINFIPVK